MRLFFAVFALALIFVWSLAGAKPIADFSSGNLHIQIGKSSLVKTYVSNPNSTFANISVWLGGDYPAALAKFSLEAGLYLTLDQRNLTVGLNPKEQRIVNIAVLSTGPPPSPPGYYNITLNANTTADSSLKDYDSMKVFMDYAPNFPGLELWGILLILNAAGLIYWKIRK